jgi:dephospho-CoA kinase
MIIGISGTLGSGKDTVAETLKSFGFQHISTADLLREEAKKLGRSVDRETLRKTGNELRTKFGSGYLVDLALSIKKTDQVVISGIRSSGEVDKLKSLPYAYLIFVDAPIELRFQRISERKRNVEDNSTLEQFRESENVENAGNSNAQNLSYCKSKADLIIENNSTKIDLEQKIKLVLTKLKQI